MRPSIAIPSLRRVVTAGLLVTGVLIGMFALYITSVRQTVISNECDVLADMSAQTSLTIARQLANDFETLQTVAARLPWPGNTQESQLTVLRDVIDTTGYKAMGLAFEDGHSFSTNASDLDLRERAYIQEAFQGHTLISKTLSDVVDGQPINVYATPVVRDGRTVAVLYAVLPAAFFKRLLAARHDDEGHAFVVHHDGTKAFWKSDLLETPNNNIFDDLEATATRHDPDLATLRKQMNEGQNGLFSCRIGGAQYYMTYRPLEVNDWYLLSLVPDSVIEEKAADFVGKTLLLVGGMLAIVFSLFCYMYRSEVRNRRIINDKVKELSLLATSIPGGVIQTRHNAELDITYVNPELCHMLGYGKKAFLDTFDRKYAPIIDEEDLGRVLEELQEVTPESPHRDLEYRILHENGQRIWVRERVQLFTDNGQNFLCGVILSIQNEKTAMQHILMDTERYRLLFDLSDSILFDLDMGTGLIAYSKKYTELFGGELVQHNFPQSAIDSQSIHPEDLGLFMDFFECLYGGADSLEQEMRLLNKKGDYLWCNVSGTTIFDADQISSKVIGRIDVIDSQKRQMEELKTESQLDPFTKLYNKVSTLQHIRTYIETPDAEPAAFFIVDIDNFKYVNDTFGHATGDTVILGLAGELRVSFRSSDIIGRIGGDEFVVLAKGINFESFSRKLPVLAAGVHHVICTDNREHKVTTSMGVALFPEHGTTYEELYRRADEALYFTKQVKGKNGVSTYIEVLEHAAKGIC